MNRREQIAGEMNRREHIAGEMNRREKTEDNERHSVTHLGGFGRQANEMPFI